MLDLHPCRGLFQTARDLQVAPGISGRDDLGSGRGDVPHLALQERVGLLRLGQRVYPRASTAPRRLGQLGQGDPGEQAQQSPGLSRDLLAVHQVTGLVVVPHGWSRTRGGGRNPSYTSHSGRRQRISLCSGAVSRAWRAAGNSDGETSASDGVEMMRRSDRG